MCVWSKGEVELELELSGSHLLMLVLFSAHLFGLFYDFFGITRKTPLTTRQ